MTRHSHLWICRARLGEFRSPKPQHGVFKEMVLCLVIKDVVAVAHIHIEHTVVSVGPYDGEVAAGDDVLETDGIVLRREGEKNFDISVETRAWTPVVPLIGG